MSNQHSSAMVQRSASSGALSGTVSDAHRANALLEEASKKFHLVSPATSCAELPEGCSVSLSSVQVSVAGGEAYDVGGGKLALGKSALDRIASAAGVSWLPGQSRRLDDGSDPRYVMFVAVGAVRAFDGTTLTIQGTKEVDLRDGSPQIDALIAKARAKQRDPSLQIREMRLHILSHAESKAKLRAIRSLGLKSSYLPAELAKPFVVARLFFSGATSDPQLRRLFALKRADAMLGGVRVLYGEAAAASMALPSLVRPPALGAGTIDEEDELPAEPAPEPAPPAPACEIESSEAAPPKASGLVVPGGQEKDFPIESASVATLKWWLNTLTKNVAEGRSRSAEKDLAWIEATRMELAKREGDDCA